MKSGLQRHSSESREKPLKVFWITNWTDNPYLSSLVSNLQVRGAEVEVCAWSLIFAPQVLQRKSRILHLHLLLDYLPGRNAVNRWIKLLLFIGQLSLLKVAGIKIVWTVHEWSDKLYGGQHNLSRLQSLIVGVFLDAVIVHSHSTGQEISQAFGIPEGLRLSVIPHGNYIGVYENTIAQHDARSRLGIPPQNTMFLLFGHIYRYKGILEAIDAFKHLPQPATLSLVIAGQSGEDGLEDCIRAQIGDRPNIVFVHARIPEAEVQIYMNAADFVLLPYQTLTTSGVAVLAMSFAKACIAPDVGFFADVLSPAGAIFYDAHDRRGLIQAMATAIEQREIAQQMGDRNLQTAQQWSWSYIADQTWKLYQSI
jgi:glycosyltransferase involved in cell wall biosynthesis